MTTRINLEEPHVPTEPNQCHTYVHDAMTTESGLRTRVEPHHKDGTACALEAIFGCGSRVAALRCIHTWAFCV
jgi:hypothetical protein